MKYGTTVLPDCTWQRWEYRLYPQPKQVLDLGCGHFYDKAFRRQTFRRQTIDRQAFRRHGSDVSTTHFGRFDDNPWTSVMWLSAGSTLSCGFESSCWLETWTARFWRRFRFDGSGFSSSGAAVNSSAWIARFRRLLRFRFGSSASGSTVNLSIGSSAVQSSTGWPLQGNKPVEGWQGTSRTMWLGLGAVSDDDVHMSVTVPCGISSETYFWRVFRAWPKNFTVCQGPFENCSPSTAVRRLLQQLTPTYVQDLRSF